MPLFAVSVRDSAVESFNRPFFVPSLGLASRSFSDEVNNPQGEMRKHPGDYELYHVGFFDELTGEFKSQKPVRVVRAIDVFVKE